jgi:hypothetical protein
MNGVSTAQASVVLLEDRSGAASLRKQSPARMGISKFDKKIKQVTHTLLVVPAATSFRAGHNLVLNDDLGINCPA